MTSTPKPMKPIFFYNTDGPPISLEEAVVVVLIFLICSYLYLKD
jgi:hypothetical protein